MGAARLDKALARGRLAVAALAALGVACAGSTARARRRDAAHRLVRHGLERIAVPYDDPHAAAKRILFERINRDRLRHGLRSLEYEPRAALVGDLFCLEAALSGSTGHWDIQGRAPYLRWGLAGGLDYHAQNAGSYSNSSGVLDRSLAELLIDRHEAMMAETPPRDGHRRLILEPLLTHVGIGVAAVGGEFRMSQEFTRVALEWMEVPDRPLPAGSQAVFSGRPLEGWAVGAVEIRHEPPPRPLTLSEARRGRSYAYPAVVRTLLPRPPVIHAGGEPDLEVRRDRTFRLSFPLDAGPGHYFVVCHLWPEARTGEPAAPATAAMVTAVD